MEQRQKNQDLGMQLVIDRIGLLHSDVSELRGDVSGSLKDISTALTALVVLDQKQVHQNAIIQIFERNLEEIKNKQKEQNTRISEIEISMPEIKRTSSWIYSAILATIAASAAFILKTIGLI